MTPRPIITGAIPVEQIADEISAVHETVVGLASAQAERNIANRDRFSHITDDFKWVKATLTYISNEMGDLAKSHAELKGEVKHISAIVKWILALLGAGMIAWVTNAVKR